MSLFTKMWGIFLSILGPFQLGKDMKRPKPVSFLSDINGYPAFYYYPEVFLRGSVLVFPVLPPPS